MVQPSLTTCRWVRSTGQKIIGNVDRTDDHYGIKLGRSIFQPTDATHNMSHTVQCAKLGKEAEGLDFQSWPGDLGKRIFDNISKEAWAMWLDHQTMLINEYRLNPMDPKAKEAYPRRNGKIPVWRGFRFAR